MEEIKEISIKDIAGEDQHISKHEKSSIKRVYTEKLSKSDSKNARLMIIYLKTLCPVPPKRPRYA